MTNKEAIEIIKAARAEVEWEYPMEYAAAFDKAIEALEKCEKIEKIIKSWKDGTIEEKDSIYAFHKIIGVVGDGMNGIGYIDIQNESADRMNEQDESNYIKDMVAINNRLNDFSERIENIEKQMQEEKEEELKKLEAELNYAKLSRTLPIITKKMPYN
jgi:hypothetical protein